MSIVRVSNIKSIVWLSLALSSVSHVSQAKDYLVKSQDEYKAVAKTLKAGDNVILANGEWRDFELLFKGTGNKGKHISLSAQTKGKVLLTGLSNLRLAGQYLHVSGLVFKDGYSPTGEVISFRQNSKNLAFHSRVSEVVIDRFNNPDKFDADKWVVMYGQHNRFDHNHLTGKSNAGVTMAVRLNSEDSQQNHHRIDHNYFGPRPILGSNGGETLRIGTSKYSLTDSFTQIDHNYFDRCNGEVEIISNKSGKNKITDNVFFEARGTLTLRHGNGNVVENNVFFGNGKEHTGGLRVINADQTVRNNYLEGIAGVRFGGGLVVMNGVPNSPINRYHQVNNATVTNNTLVDVDNILFGAGSDKERSATPQNSRYSNNLMVGKASPFTLFDDMSGIEFSGNLVNFEPTPFKKGFDTSSIDMKRKGNGLLYPVDKAQRKVGVSENLKVINKADVGVSWYAKEPNKVEFASGKKQTVSSAAAFYKAVNNAQHGHVIELTAGEYALNKRIVVKSKISVVAKKGAPVTLLPQRSLTFEIADGGSLSLEGLTIDGVQAPDSAGNVLIRNTKIPTLLNFDLRILNSQIVNLDVNHSFHVFDAGYRSFADHITIKNSIFKNVTGDILRLNKEQDDLGIYNAEYLTLTNNEFTNIRGAIAKVYRGGTDESTFGPHVVMSQNVIQNVGKGKRNKQKAFMLLHGVQVTSIENNQVSQSAPLAIVHTVGEPNTQINDNVFTEAHKLRITSTVDEAGENGLFGAKASGNQNLTVSQ